MFMAFSLEVFGALVRFSLLIRPYTFSSRLWYNVLLLLLVLGLNCQNKPNGFSSCCVLRGGAEIIRFILILIDWGTAQTSVMDYNNLLLDNNNLLPDYNGGYNSLGQSSIIISYKLH